MFILRKNIDNDDLVITPEAHARLMADIHAIEEQDREVISLAQEFLGEIHKEIDENTLIDKADQELKINFAAIDFTKARILTANKPLEIQQMSEAIAKNNPQEALKIYMEIIEKNKELYTTYRNDFQRLFLVAYCISTAAKKIDARKSLIKGQELISELEEKYKIDEQESPGYNIENLLRL